MLILNVNIFQMQYKITYSIKHCVELFWINPIFLIIFNDFCLLFVCGLSSHSKIFTHMETSPLWAKGCKFWPVLGTHCYWALNGPRLLWHGPKLCNGHLRGSVTLAHVAELSSCHYLFQRLRSVPNSCMQSERSIFTPSRHFTE